MSAPDRDRLGKTEVPRFGAALAAMSLVAFFVAAGSAAADDRDAVLVMRLADLEAQGRCVEAVEMYAQHGKPDARMALVAGRCQVRAGNYAGAVDTLTPVRSEADAPADVELQLAIAEYHMGDLDAARSSLDRARVRGSEGAMVDLYTGLLQLQADEARNAANSLERARRANPQAVEPVASYYAFLAWRSIEEEERAEAALERLRESDPDGPWIAEAEKLLGKQPTVATPRFWATVTGGVEYDTNVPIKGGFPLAFINGETVARKKDFRGVWSVEAGTELFHTDDWSGGLIGSYTGTQQFEMTAFDSHYVTGAAWVDYFATARTTLRAQYDYGYSVVNEDPYSHSHIATGTLFQNWEDIGLTELSFAAGFYDYKYDKLDPDGPLDPDDDGPGPDVLMFNALDVRDIDRDGIDLSPQIVQRYRPGFEDLELHAGYRYTWYISDGFEFDYMAHRFFAGFDVTLPLEMDWSVYGAYTYRPFDDVSAYQSRVNSPVKLSAGDARHRDNQYEVGTELEKFVTEHVSVLARYQYLNSDSNTGEYDFQRHVVGAHVRVHFR